MKDKFFFSSFVTILVIVSNFSVAGPGNGKGNEEAIIEHTPPAKHGKGNSAEITGTTESGSVEIAVSVSSVPSHINHGDCIVEDGDGNSQAESFPHEWYCLPVPQPE